MSTDKQWIANLSKVKRPETALRIIVENERYLGYDPYYRALRAAMLKMAERVLRVPR